MVPGLACHKLLLCLAKLCPRANCPTESSRAPRHIKQAMHCSTMGQLLPQNVAHLPQRAAVHGCFHVLRCKAAIRVLLCSGQEGVL